MGIEYQYRFATKKYAGSIFRRKAEMKYERYLKTMPNGREWKVKEGEICPDIFHMLVSIHQNERFSGFHGILEKGKSSLMILQKWGNMKFAIDRNREFWCKGIFVTR